ncbi:MAG: DUF2924 domain-containing protein, partial [Planctomycetes bacterium]|nr:DUF2924 domain-containing protein [Planctomycetota bacterium]
MNIGKEIAALKRMRVGELRDKWLEVFGDVTKTRNRDYLVKRIAWRVQADEEGGLSERALARA